MSVAFHAENLSVRGLYYTPLSDNCQFPAGRDMVDILLLLDIFAIIGILRIGLIR